MSASCQQLREFMDQRLDEEAHGDFEAHLLGCAACQRRFEDTLQLEGLGVELARERRRPQAVTSLTGEPEGAEREPWLRRPGHWLAFAAAAAVVGLAVLVATRQLGRAPDQPLDRRLAAVLAPQRSIEDRLAYPAADQHREYGVARSASARGEVIPAELVARFEARGDLPGLVALQLLEHDWDAAERVLADRPHQPALDLERAVLARSRGQLPEALALVDAVLVDAPRSPQGLWNRGLILRDLNLQLAAAQAFDAVAALGEPGWADEARRYAKQQRAAESERAQSWRIVQAGCRDLSSGLLPDAATVGRYPALCRRALTDAVAHSGTRAQVERLLPVAEQIDAAMGDGGTSAVVRRIAAGDFAARAAGVALLARLSEANAPKERKQKLLAQLEATRQDDLVLLAMARAGWQDHAQDYLRRLRAAGDPLLAELAEEREAELELDTGNPLAAELRLRRAVAACTPREVEYRCSQLHLLLTSLYLRLHRPVEARATALAGLRRSLRLGMFWDERLLFDRLADAARFSRQHSLMRAYLAEATLRSDGECKQGRYEHELLAIVASQELHPDEARRQIDAAPTCSEPPTMVRAVVIADLARSDGSPAEAAALRQGLEAQRRAGTLSPGGLANTYAIEGRLLAAHDPAAARPLLERAIADAARLGARDVDAAKAGAYAYRTLLLLDAEAGDFEGALGRFARSSGIDLRPGCSLGVLVDGERALIVARDAGGGFHHQLSSGRARPDFDAATLVPAAITQALAACPRVDVLALPPVYGSPGLLPAALAWSYRGQAPAPAPLPGPPVVLTIADAETPPELGLPRLRPLDEAPMPGTSEVQLRGPAATPARVAAAMAGADVVEIHAHGFVDLGLSDASLIALSPQADGVFALSARTVSGLHLKRAPLVILAACHAAHTAPYLHDRWSLPYAFLLAGARAVLAPATPIPDAEATAFFRAVETRVLRGEDPAIVLRDERVRRPAGSWVEKVLLFD